MRQFTESCKAAPGLTTHAHLIAKLQQANQQQQPGESEMNFSLCPQSVFKEIIMFAKTIISAVFAASFIVLSATAAHANETDYLPTPVVKSTLTRAEVRAELLKGPTAHDRITAEWAQAAPQASFTGMPLSRAQVLAELREAQRVGALDRYEHSSLPTPAQLESIRQAGLRAAQMQMASL
jgi:hypothetical protein